MDKKTAQEILNQTAEIYNEIAPSFSQTRQWLPKEIESLITSNIRAADKVLDIGCGNGRACDLFAKLGADYTGIDNSKKLVEIAREQYPGTRFIVADAADLPFPAESFNVAAALAVLHHIPSKDLRTRFFYEAGRVLKPGAILIASVWDLRPWRLARAGEWKRFRLYAKEQLAIATGRSKLDFGDFFIPWQNKCQRYVHAFALGELRSLAASVGLAVIASGILRSSRSREQNLYIVCQKA
jgi:SAM-dependent methyltransferase